MTGIAGGAVAIGSGAYAAASGWTTPEGLSAFLTSLVGVGALVWSIYSARARQRGLDAKAAAEYARAFLDEQERRRREGESE